MSIASRARQATEKASWQRGSRPKLFQRFFAVKDTKGRTTAVPTRAYVVDAHGCIRRKDPQPQYPNNRKKNKPQRVRARRLQQQLEKE